MYQSQTKTSFVVREQLFKVEQQKHALVIGIPKENQCVEKRLALTPETVSLLVDGGFRVLLETGAGLAINYSDRYYSDSGADIVATAQEVYQADIVLKMTPPTVKEVRMMRPRTTLFSFLQLQKISAPLLELMAEKRINALAYELITDKSGSSPFVTAISEIEGMCSITLAAELLSNAYGGKGILLGGVPGVSPTEIAILGAGVAGTMAARTALALGATVKVFDDDVLKLRTIRSELQVPIFTSTFQPNVLRNVFRSTDVVIGAMQYINKPQMYRIAADLVHELKKGALIIDLQMAQGGCFETTMEACIPGHPAVFEKFGILHHCELSISSRVARTASIALSNIFTSMFLSMSDLGSLEHFARFDSGFSAGYYMYSGRMVHPYVANLYGMPVVDMGLFLPRY